MALLLGFLHYATCVGCEVSFVGLFPIAAVAEEDMVIGRFPLVAW